MPDTPAKTPVVAVICECNPFHAGHAALLRGIRERLPGATPVAVMSGNFTQRGEAALFDKYTRARAAVDSGFSLVMELPFPFCASSAPVFAAGGCAVAAALPAVTHLAFGSESGDLTRLTEASRYLHSPAALSEMEALRQSEAGKKMGDAALREAAAPEYADLLRAPNDILALEYLAAIEDTRLSPLVIRRKGDDRDPDPDSPCPGASALRALYYREGGDALLSRLSPAAAAAFAPAIEKGEVAATEFCGTLALPLLRLADAAALRECAECGGGLADRLIRAAQKSTEATAFFAALRSKACTDAKLRRAVLFAALGLREQALHTPPAYTQVLAADRRGCELLGEMRGETAVAVLTKAADGAALTGSALTQWKTGQRADALYTLMLKKPLPAAAYLTVSPYIAEQKTPEKA